MDESNSAVTATISSIPSRFIFTHPTLGGAGPILHQLFRNRETLGHMFQREILQSLAFEPKYNVMHHAAEYDSFKTAAGCPATGWRVCVQKTTEELQTANMKGVNLVQYGTFGWGKQSTTHLTSTSSRRRVGEGELLEERHCVL